MIITSEYKLRKLVKKLKAGTAWVTGQVSGGGRWPERPHYWAVDDSDLMQTHHVPCDLRRSWGKYYRIL